MFSDFLFSLIFSKVKIGERPQRQCGFDANKFYTHRNTISTKRISF